MPLTGKITDLPTCCELKNSGCNPPSLYHQNTISAKCCWWNHSSHQFPWSRYSHRCTAINASCPPRNARRGLPSNSWAEWPYDPTLASLAPAAFQFRTRVLIITLRKREQEINEKQKEKEKFNEFRMKKKEIMAMKKLSQWTCYAIDEPTTNIEFSSYFEYSTWIAIRILSSNIQKRPFAMLFTSEHHTNNSFWSLPSYKWHPQGDIWYGYRLYTDIYCYHGCYALIQFILYDIRDECTRKR